MRPIRVSLTGSPEVSTPIVIDQYLGPTNIALGVQVSGTITYTVQHTYDDPFAVGFNPATAVWFNHSTLSAQTTNAESNYAYPPRAVRLTTTAGTGTATLTLVQSGATG